MPFSKTNGDHLIDSLRYVGTGTLWKQEKEKQAIVRLVLMALLGLWLVAMFGMMLSIGKANFDYTNSMFRFQTHDMRVAASWMVNGCK